ncbi:MAG: TylF/MycF/NovP-related O-methyltransferase [Pseudomonadota bacterium]
MDNPIKTLLDRRRAKRRERKQRTIGAHMVWRDQPFWQKAQADHGQVKGIPDIRLYFLQSLIRSLENVDGDIAECGVRHGKSALYMWSAMSEERRSARTIFLFDSFEGLSDPIPGRDQMDTVVDENTGKRLFDIGGPAQVLKRFEDKNVEVKTGWIPDRFPEVETNRFALVHVDVDLYQPTKDTIEFFYDRMVPFGVMVCDDYGSGSYPGAREAIDEFFADKAENIVELPQGQSFIIKRPT